MLKKTLGKTRAFQVQLLLASVIGSSVFAVANVRAGELANFVCCAQETDCRHVDNDKDCTNQPGICNNDGNFKYCCSEAVCTKAPGEQE